MGSFDRKPLQLRSDAKILVRTPNWIGDVVIGTASLCALRRSFPGARISVLAKPWVIPVLRHNPHIDEIVQYDRAGIHKGVKGLFRLSRYLRCQEFDAAFLFQRAIEAAIIARLARIPVRVGYGTDARGLLLTHRLRATREGFLVPRLQHDLGLLEAFGLKADRNELFLMLGAAQKEGATGILKEIGVAYGDRLFALCPGSIRAYKRWLPARFGALARRIADAFSARGILLGTPNEEDLCKEILSIARVPGLVNLAGRTSLEEAIALTAFCGLFVTNDSGLMHVAAALDVPLVAIFGPTDARRTAPWSMRHAIVTNEELDCQGCEREDCDKGYPCLTGITVDQVFHVVHRLLDRYAFATVGERTECIPALDWEVPVVLATQTE